MTPQSSGLATETGHNGGHNANTGLDAPQIIVTTTTPAYRIHFISHAVVSARFLHGLPVGIKKRVKSITL